VNILEQYKSKVIEVERARLRLEQLESELRTLENRLRVGAHSIDAEADVPERLKYLVDIFKKGGGRMSLNDVAKRVKITRTGVWNQVKKLVQLGRVRQVDRGLYELVTD